SDPPARTEAAGPAPAGPMAARLSVIQEAPAVKADGQTPTSTTPKPPQPAGSDAAPKGSSEHVMFGGTPDRNMVNLTDKGVSDKPDPEGPGLKWKAELGSRAYGGPIIAGGKVYVGTNN